MKINNCQIYSYTPENFSKITQNIHLKDIKESLNTEGVMWLNMHRVPTESELLELGKIFKLHRTTREDILDLSQRPKVEEFEDYLFFSLTCFIPSHKADALRTEQISFILGKNFVLSIQERKADHFQTVRDRIENNTGILRTKKADYLVYRLLDVILDSYFTSLEKITEESELLDVEVTNSPEPESLNKIERIKRTLIFLRKLIFPIKEIVSRLDNGFPRFIAEDNQPYFRDLKDSTQSLLDETDTNKQIIESMAQMYYATLSHKMNEIMKVLTMVGTIFIPLTFIAGIYGMNFTIMPELHWEFGYFGVWIIMIVLAILLLIYFRRKKWF